MVTTKLNISVTTQEEKGHCIQPHVLSDLADKSKVVILFYSSVLSG